METILKTVVLGGLCLMFYAKISDGSLAFYINQRFAWLSFVAVLILAALAFTLVYRLMEQSAHRRAAHTAASHDHDQAAEAHDHTHRISWASIAILAVPVVLGLFIPARPLGASAVSSRGIGLSAPDRPGGVTTVQRAPSGPKNVLDWLRDFAATPDPTAFQGQAVDVVGFVYRDPRNGPNQFWVSRFTISCCVADATAVGMLVQSDAAGSLVNDRWVRVTGKLGVGEFAGEKVPLILPAGIEPVDQPDHPYLYP
jgi:uncharacterized repeat protein (TIGR03943 family)